MQTEKHGQIPDQKQDRYIVRGATESDPDKRFVAHNTILNEYPSPQGLVEDGWLCDFEDFYMHGVIP